LKEFCAECENLVENVLKICGKVGKLWKNLMKTKRKPGKLPGFHENS
jgi:hypothetical protein